MPASGYPHARKRNPVWLSESQFVDAYIRNDAASHSIAGADHVVLRERSTSYGRPDLLLVSFDARALANRVLAPNLPPLSRLAALAQMHLVHRRWVSLDKLASFLRTTVQRAASIVSQLEARDLVLRRGSNLRSRPLDEILVIRGVTAAEAKLRAWRRALSQAARHLWFADASHVLLGGVGLSATKLAAGDCRAAGVGLIVSGTSGPTDLVVPSPTRQVPMTWLTWLLNEQSQGGAAPPEG